MQLSQQRMQGGKETGLYFPRMHLCSTYFDEINPPTEGLPPSRLGLELGRKERKGKEKIRNKGMKF